jgi:hypothetical protein
MRAGERFTRIMVLDDVEAVFAGIDRWPLQPGEAVPIVRTHIPHGIDGSSPTD